MNKSSILTLSCFLGILISSCNSGISNNNQNSIIQKAKILENTNLSDFIIMKKIGSGNPASYINIVRSKFFETESNGAVKPPEMLNSFVYSDANEKNRAVIYTLGIDFNNSHVAQAGIVPVRLSNGYISAGAATDIKAKADDIDNNVDILYRDALTNNFHVKKYVFAKDDVTNAVIEETGGINCPTASNPTAQCAFQAQDQTAINNSADFARDKNGNMYVAYINGYGYPMVDVYDQKQNKYAPINFREYKDGLGSIPDASEINIQIDKQDNLPIIAVVRGGKNSHIVLYKFKPKTSVPTSGLSFNSMGNWDYYPGTTGTNLSATKVDNLSFILDHNNVPLLAFNQNDTQGGHLGVEEVLNNQINVLSSLGNNQYVSEGVVNNVHVVENMQTKLYVVSYSDLGMNSSVSPNYAPGMIMVAKYSLGNNSWSHTRQYIDQLNNQVQGNGQHNSVLATENGDIILAYSDVNNNGSMTVNVGRNLNPFIYNDSHAPVPNPESSVKMVFITKQTFNGNMGGYAGADQSCVNDPNNPLGIGHGHWRALLWANPSLPAQPKYSYENLYGTLLVESEVDQSTSVIAQWLGGDSGLNAAIVGNNSGNPVDQTFWTGWARYDYDKAKAFADSTVNNPNFSFMTNSIPYYQDYAGFFDNSNPIPITFFKPDSNSDSDITNYANKFNCNSWTSEDPNRGGEYGNNKYYNTGSRYALMGLAVLSDCGNIPNDHLKECSNALMTAHVIVIPSLIALMSPFVINASNNSIELLREKYLKINAIRTNRNYRSELSKEKTIQDFLNAELKKCINPRGNICHPVKVKQLKEKLEYTRKAQQQIVADNRNEDDAIMDELLKFDSKYLKDFGVSFFGTGLLMFGVAWEIKDAIDAAYTEFNANSWSGSIYNQFVYGLLGNVYYNPIVLAQHNGLNLPTNNWNDRSQYRGIGVDNNAPINYSNPNQDYVAFPKFASCTEEKPILCTGPYEN